MDYEDNESTKSFELAVGKRKWWCRDENSSDCVENQAAKSGVSMAELFSNGAAEIQSNPI